MRLLHALARRLIDRGAPSRRKPDFIVGTPEKPYLRRWWLIPRNPILNIYLHHFVGDDDDRALHDHPWWSLSLLLRGRLVEHTERTNPDTGLSWHSVSLLYPGALRIRSARFAHRLALNHGHTAWTLFITGPVLREWGFHCPHGWVPWQAFTSSRDKGQIGAGCEGQSRPPRSWWRVVFQRGEA